MRHLIICAAFTFLSSCAMAQKTTVPDSVLGDWYGESKCVGSNTSCHDEIVIYHLAAVKTESAKVHWSADRVVNGKADSMGDLDFDYDVANSVLTSEFKIPRTGGKAVWSFKIDGDKMHGTLTTYPENEVGRKVEVSRKKPANFPI
jgi:hypothetical protein